MFAVWAVPKPGNRRLDVAGRLKGYTTTVSQEQDLVNVIVNDHREVEQVFTQLEEPGVEPQRRKELVDHVIAELVRHSVAEEQYMYPAARRYLDNGDEIADHEISEHAEAESGHEATGGDGSHRLRIRRPGAVAHRLDPTPHRGRGG